MLLDGNDIHDLARDWIDHQDFIVENDNFVVAEVSIDFDEARRRREELYSVRDARTQIGAEVNLAATIAVDAGNAPDDVVKLRPLRPGDMDADPLRGAGSFAAKALAFGGGAGVTLLLAGFSASIALALTLLAPPLRLLRGGAFGCAMALGVRSLAILGPRVSIPGLAAIFSLAPLLLARLALLAGTFLDGVAAAVLLGVLMLGGTFVLRGAALFALALLGATSPFATLALLRLSEREGS